LLSGKRFDATEDRSRDRPAYRRSVRHRGHASEICLKRTCSGEPRSSWHCLAIIDSVWAAFVEVGARLDPKQLPKEQIAW